MLTRKSGILALVFGAFVLGACEQKAPEVTVIVPTDSTVTVTIAGAPQTPVKKGTSIQLVAVVNGSSNQAVTWSVLSGATSASVSATGLVTTIAPGTAVIQAVSQANPSAKGAVAIQVADTGATTVPPTTGQPSITIASVTQFGTLFPVNPGNVNGTVDVTMNVDIPAGVQASKLQISLAGPNGTVVVPCQTFTGSTSSDVSAEGAEAPQTIVCSINTAALNANGTPVFVNGTYTATAQLLGPTGTVIAQAVSPSLIFNNTSAQNISVTASCNNTVAPAACPTTGPGGLLWSTGDLVVTVTPAIYAPAPNNTTNNVTVTVTDLANAISSTQTISTANASGQFVATFPRSATPANGGVSTFQGPVQVTVNSVVANQTGPSNTTGSVASPAIRLDNVAPVLGGGITTPASGWVGANTTMSSFGAALAGTDAGVDTDTTYVQFSTTSGTAGFSTFTAVSALPQTTTASGVWIRAMVCDKLHNCTTTAANQVGVDLTAPTISQLAANDTILETSGERTATNELVVAGVENASGFPASGSYVQVQIVQTTAAGTKCIDPNTGAASAVPSSGTCAFVNNTNDTGIDINTATDGYYVVTARLVDNAGNVSSTVSRTFLVDTTAPTASVTGLAFTASQVTVNGTASDDVDLRGWQANETWAGANISGTGLNTLPFSQLTNDGSFGLPLTTSVSASATEGIIRQVDGFNLSNVGFGAVDVADNFGSGNIGFTSTGDGFDNAGNFTAAFGTYAPTTSSSVLCRSGTSTACGSANVGNTSTTITFAPVTAANTNNPISTVYFYALIPASNGVNYARLIGSTSTSSLTINTPGNTRNWTYTASLPTTLLPPVVTPGTTYNVTVFAVAVDAQGDALSSAQSGAVNVR